MGKNSKVAHIVLNVASVDARTKFYAEVFGMEVVARRKEMHPLRLLPRGSGFAAHAGRRSFQRHSRASVG